MKKLIPLLFLFSCSQEPKPIVEESQSCESIEIIKDEFQTILDAAGVNGSILIMDDKHYYSNDFEWAKKGRLPASTFKIPNSIIALELGVIENDSTQLEWDGKPRFKKRWEQDLTFKEAFHLSCVPCYQEIARAIGLKRMKNYLYDLNYGNMSFDSTNLDLFWLKGESEINQYQQISFLKVFNEQRLPISRRTHAIMRRLMIIEENENFTLRGKTGWAVTDQGDNCWYVGYVETGHGFYYFATNIEPGEQSDMDSFPALRRTVTDKALEILGVFD